MDAEGVSVLRVLVRGQDLKFQLLANSSPGAVESAYAYLQAKYVNFPVKLNEVPDEQEVLINEFLVKVGAAKVDEAQDFSRKAKLLKVQSEAKEKGEGVWSYQVL
jgi:endonuclease YncB( thermonuclease family)